ncbi:hypothetical protein [Piscinibacter sakaiensis]|uniref:hypothetical protein n=1 Tax=Piscinibacter sakaiensis TaxID=1547922 RepID=UPI003AAB872A
MTMSCFPNAGAAPAVPALTAAHRRRLRAIWRSAGWPCHDLLEVEMIAAGWLERRLDGGGRESLRVSDAGVTVLASELQRNRRLRDAHEALVQRVATQMLRAGRITWCGLGLRAQPVADGPWVIAMPDVFSIRNSSVEAYLAPTVHEIKVRRADLLSDLRNPAKRAAYLHVSSECWYVLAEGIAEPDEIPPECGVLIARSDTLDVARPAPRRPTVMRLATWTALARANALPAWRPDDDQPLLEACAPDADEAACIDRQSA